MIKARQITSSSEGLASRSEAITRVCDEHAEHATPPASFRTAARDWCVDADSVIMTLSTFELWEALERGQVQAWMRVWREGMECWTPVGEIAEFAWALAQTPGNALVSLREDAERLGPLTDLEPARTAPPPPPASGEGRRPASGVRWIAMGSLVAASAVASALVFAATFAPSRSEQSADRIVGATSQRMGARDAVPSETSDDAPVVHAPARSARASHGSVHAERGQERMPRGGRSAER